MPSGEEGGVRYAFSPPRERGTGAVHGLPQPARHGEAEAGAYFVHAGSGLLHLPYGQAGAVCVRTRAGEGRRLRILPPGAWRAESAHVEAEQREPAVPAVPYHFQLQRGAGSAFVPQPGQFFPILRAVPFADSRLELRCDVLQVVRAVGRALVRGEADGLHMTVTAGGERAFRRGRDKP